MHIINEWLDSESAKQDAEQFFKNIYLMQGRRCGKTAFALYQMKKYLEDHPDATVVMPYRQGYSYVKELMNSVYWNKKPPYDDVPYDAVRYAIEEFEIKQREERLEKAKLNRDEIKEMLNNSRYGICWPSELIESCERIDKYREEEFMMELLNEGYIRAIDYGLGHDCTDVYVRVFANTMNSVKFNFYRRSSIDPIYTVKFTNPTWNEHDVCDRCREVTNDNLVWQLFVSKNIDFLARCRKKYDALTKQRDSAASTGTITQKKLYLGRNFGAGSYIRPDGEDVYYCIAECCINPGRINGKTKAYLRAFRKPHAVSMESWARTVKRYDSEYIRKYHGMEETTLYYYIYDDGRVEIPCYELVADNDYPHKPEFIADRVDMDNIDISKEMEMLKNYKKKMEETTEMKGYKFMVPKGVFGSKVYIQDKNSDAITYAGTLTDMHLETASGCEMHGNIDFIADDAPVERLANLDRGFIKNVVFHDPATIVEWKDGTKTVVQARDGEKFDPEKGLAMAISKKALGNKRDYYHTFKHYLKKVKTGSVCGENVKTLTVPAELADDVMNFIAEKARAEVNKYAIGEDK